MAQPPEFWRSLFANAQEIEIDTALPTYYLASTAGVQKKKERVLQRQERARRGHDALPFSAAALAALYAAGVKVRIRPFPIHDLCGAKTRKGQACRCLALKNGRCRLHGGLSTGPKTKDGWARTHAGFAAWVKRNQEGKAGAVLGPNVEKT